MIDLVDAMLARDEGMARALEHAEDVVPTWGQVALAYLVSYARDHLEFISEDVSTYARNRGFADPSPRAWGNVFRTAIRRGIIVPIGYVPSPSRHCSPTPKYRSTSYWSAE